MKCKAIIIDDDFSNCELLHHEIIQLDMPINILGSFDNPIEGLKAIKKLKPNLLFLDIEMPHINGFELLDLLDSDYEYDVIFVTAFNAYAIQAFNYCAIDYLLKPINSNRLRQAIEKAMTKPRQINKEDITLAKEILASKNDHPSKIVVPIKSGYQMMDLSDIVRCEADSNYTYLFLSNGNKLLVSRSLIHFENLLSKNNFMRVHQSHLINLDYVVIYNKADGGWIQLRDGENVPVSRNYKAMVSDFFKNISI